MILMCPEYLKSDASAEHDVRQSVDFLLKYALADGNVAPSLSEVDIKIADEDALVHWCHGGPG